MAKSSVKIGGKEVPLTKSGLPNKRYLNAAQKKMIDDEVSKRKAARTAAELKELADLLAKL